MQVAGAVFGEQLLEKVDYESPRHAISIIHGHRNEQRSKNEEVQGTFRIVGRIRGILRRSRTRTRANAGQIGTMLFKLIVRFDRISIIGYNVPPRILDASVMFDPEGRP